MDWWQLATKRISFALASYRDPTFKFHTLSLATILGAVEVASRWLKTCSASRSVPLFHILDPSRSIPYQATWFISSPLSAWPTIKIWKASGWPCFETLQREQPKEVESVRRSAVTAAVWVKLKLVDRYMKWPRGFAMVADQTRTYESRAQVAQAFWHCSEHDLDAGFSLPFKRRLGHWRDFFLPVWQELLFWWARAFRLHSQRSEFKHSANRRNVTSTSDYMHFVSRGAN